MYAAVDIVLPCFNPGNKWPIELENFYNEVKSHYQLNFIIVNDGTKEENLSGHIRALKSKGIPLEFLSYPENKGKGFALRMGVKQAQSDMVVYTDIDFPFTNNSMLSLIDTLADGNYDVIAGHRSEAYYQKKMSGFRILLSKAFRFFLKKIINIPISDTQCGLKGFNKKGRAKFLATTINRYLFDFEFIFTSCKDSTIYVKAHEVQLKDNVVFSKMRVKVLLQESSNLVKVLLFRKS